VVAPASGGLLDLVHHGVNGWLYPAGRPEVMREAIAALAGDPAQRETMGAAARESVRGRTWAGVGDQLIGHYRSLIDRNATPAIRRTGSRPMAA
jgi:phosphatidylinositol alpha 1,6-mannosyltransferase